MDFRIPVEFEENLREYKQFISQRLTPNLGRWYTQKEIPRDFFRELGARDWLGLEPDGKRIPRAAVFQSRPSCKSISGLYRPA